MRIWSLFSLFFIIITAFSYSAEAPESIDLSGAVKITLKKHYPLIINSRSGSPANQVIFGEGERKDLILKVFFPKIAEYRIVIKIPQSAGEGNALYRYNHTTNRLKIDKILYSGSINSRLIELSSTVYTLNPVISQGYVKYFFDIPVTNRGLYYIAFTAKNGERFERFPLSLIIRLKTEPETDFNELMEHYFSILKDINSILVHKNYGAYFSDYEKAKLSANFAELKKIKLLIRELSEEEKAVFRQKLFIHPEMKNFIENIRRIKKSFQFTR